MAKAPYASSGPSFSRPGGYQQLSVSGTAATLTVPTGAVVAVISVSGAAVRYRDDGVAPTASVGFPVGAGAVLTYFTALSAVEFIAQSGTATLDILYYLP